MVPTRTEDKPEVLVFDLHSGGIHVLVGHPDALLGAWSRNPLNKWLNQSVFVSNAGSNWDLFRGFLGKQSTSLHQGIVDLRNRVLKLPDPRRRVHRRVERGKSTVEHVDRGRPGGLAGLTGLAVPAGESG